MDKRFPVQEMLGKLQTQRSWSQLALDALFVAWVLHLMITGHLIPDRLADIFIDRPPAVATTDPPATQPEPPLPVPADIAPET